MKQSLRGLVLKTRAVITLDVNSTAVETVSEVYRYGTVLDTQSEDGKVLLTVMLQRPVVARLGLR